MFLNTKICLDLESIYVYNDGLAKKVEDQGRVIILLGIGRVGRVYCSRVCAYE